VQVNLEQGGTVHLESGDYKLVQFHFHTPSEEKVNGKRYPLVAHLVHKNDAGELAVVAVLFKEGHPNAALKEVFGELPAAAGEKHALGAPIDVASALPAHHAYYAYTGSLTTPPCSEGVRWQVLKEPVEVSKQQLAAFHKLYTMNARPVQPLNGRVVKVGG
jgi:carbonic anhydrase